jgi:hypothetical protein
MNTQDFFNSPVMQLPRDRDDEDFERYLTHLFKACLIGTVLTVIAVLIGRVGFSARGTVLSTPRECPARTIEVRHLAPTRAEEYVG